MLPIAGQTAEPIGLKFFVVTHGWPGGVISKKKFEIFFFHGQRRALQLVYIHIYNLNVFYICRVLNIFNFNIVHIFLKSKHCFKVSGKEFLRLNTPKNS